MWGRGSQLGSGGMAKHKPYKFACSALRLEGPALRTCNTKNRKAVEEKRRTDDVKRLKAKTTNQSLIGGKKKKGIANHEINRLLNWRKTKRSIPKDEN